PHRTGAGFRQRLPAAGGEDCVRYGVYPAAVRSAGPSMYLEDHTGCAPSSQCTILSIIRPNKKYKPAGKRDGQNHVPPGMTGGQALTRPRFQQALLDIAENWGGVIWRKTSFCHCAMDFRGYSASRKTSKPGAVSASLLT